MTSGRQVAIVTGGADGFGAAIVDRYAAEGFAVIVLDINREKGEKMASANKNNIRFLCANVMSREAWETALQVAIEDHGRIDLVVNNAGIGHDPHVCHSVVFHQSLQLTASKPIHEQDLGLYDKIFNLNVKTMFLSAHVVCPVMLKQGFGAFVNISSTGFTRPRPGMAIYNASKAAVAIATKTMALEYAPTIRFNCVAPAVGNTSMLRDSIGNDPNSAERLQKLSDSLPMKRITEPEDVANACWYLGSGQSSFVTGTVLSVDGGRGV